MPKPKILVVEDERSLVEVLSCNLEREGFEVLTAFDGQEGLRQAQLKLPDLVVLDLMLPLKGGLDVCRELRMGARTREIPVIMVTAKAEESDELVGFATGADDYVTKPYSMKVLIQRIKKELRSRQLKELPAAGSLIESQGIVIDRHSHRASIATRNCRSLLRNSDCLRSCSGKPAGRSRDSSSWMPPLVKTPSFSNARSMCTSRVYARSSGTRVSSSKPSAVSDTVSMSRGW